MTLPLATHPMSSIAQRVPGPPPLPALQQDTAGRFFDQTDDDMRQLTADIDQVLSGRPELKLVRSEPPLSRPEMARSADIDPEEAVRGFDWQATGETASDDVTDRAAGWLHRARRERRFARLRSALSWVVALTVVAGIVAAASVTFGGYDQLANALLALVQAARLAI